MPGKFEKESQGKTAVIYARFSCSKQREASIADQLRECRAWCEREGYEVVAEYSDSAMSGTTADRPEFQRMIAAAGESSIVLVYMMDRFSRDPYDAPIYKRELARRGVRLVSAVEAIPDSPEGIIYEKLLEGLAACESAKTSLRTKRGMKGNALQCKTNGVRVYGYRADENDRYEIVPEEAAFVHEAFSRRLGREAIDSIARDFAERGVRSHAGNPCGYSMVYAMLHNEKYTGRYEWDGIVREGGMPRIIDDVVFGRVQEVVSKKQRANENWGDFALAGRVICAGCGRTMPGISGRNSVGTKYEYYGCRGCGMKAVRRDWLEGEIVKVVREALSDADEARRIADSVLDAGFDKEFGEERRMAERSLKSAETGLRNLLNAVEKGIVVPGTEERIAQLEAQRDRARRDMAKFDEARIDADALALFLQSSSMLDDRQLLDAFVWQALVAEDDVVVTLNYDTIKKEPAQFSIERVLTKLEWCPRRDSNARHPL